MNGTPERDSTSSGDVEQSNTTGSQAGEANQPAAPYPQSSPSAWQGNTSQQYPPAPYPYQTGSQPNPEQPTEYQPGGYQGAGNTYPQGYPNWTPPAGPTRTRSRIVRPIAVLSGLVLLILVFVAGCAVGTRQNAAVNGVSIGGNNPTVTVPPSAKDLQQNVVNVIQTVQPSVVEVISQSSQGEGIGSGEILTPDGYIVTNDHVVAGFSQYTVNLSNGQSLSAKLVGEDPHDDLAVLKINQTGLKPINFGDSAKVVVGQFAIAMGSPLGFSQSATFGIVSALNRSASEGQNGPAQELVGMIQTSAPINPGNSGGALVNLEGQLIGIPTLGAVDPSTNSQAPGIGFAIPSNRVQYVVKQLIQYGKLVNTGQGFLGVRGTDVTPQIASTYNLPVQQGYLIVGFANDAQGQSPAQNAGLKVNDIIIAVDGQTVTGSGDLAAALLSKSPGTKVTVTVQRGNSKVNVPVTLGEYPASAAQG